MARINFDDDVESKDEFWKLLQLVGGDRDRALGMLVRFFRFAQSHYGKELPMTQTGIEEMGLSQVIASGWAVSCEGGFQVRGAEKHFSWYRQKVEAGKHGGRPAKPKEGKPEETGNNRPLSPANRTVISGNRDEPSVNPLAPAPAPSLAPAPSQKNIYITSSGNVTASPGGVTECTREWLDTLAHFKIKREAEGLISGEDYLLVSAIKRYGPQEVIYALIGARKQTANKNYNPSQFVSLNYFLDSKNFVRFSNLGRSGASAGQSSGEIDWDKFWKDKDSEAGAS